MKRAAIVLACALAFATPAHAVGPLAAILIEYVKQAVKEKVVSYAKEQLMGGLSEAVGGMPGMGMLAMMPGAAGVMRARPSLPPEAMASLQASGMFDANAQPLSDEEWREYEQTLKTMAEAGGGELPDLGSMRAMLMQMPQMTGIVRNSLNQFREMKDEQEHMREVYAQMSESERQETVAELVKNFRESPPEYQPQALHALQSEALGLPEDLQWRLLAALQQGAAG